MRGYGEVLVHGHCSSLPACHAKIPLLAVLRDPMDRYISEYEFRWWANSGVQHPYHKEIIAKYPGWPNSHSFEEEVELRHEYHTRWQNHLPVEQRVGIQTEHFIRFFCHSPRKLLSEGKRLNAETIIKALYPIEFLQMENLNQELAEFLRYRGCAEAKCRLAENHKKVLPGGRGRKKHGNLEQYYSKDLEEKVRLREALILEVISKLAKKK